MDECTKAYLAGIIDGEGSIAIGRGLPKAGSGDVSTRYWNYVKVTNTDIRLLEWVLAETGVGSIQRDKPRGGNRRPHYTWICAGVQSVRILQAVRPYLVIKKEQADLIFEFRKTFDSARWDQVRLSQETIDLRASFHAEIQRLHKRDVAESSDEWQRRIKGKKLRLAIEDLFER